MTATFACVLRVINQNTIGLIRYLCTCNVSIALTIPSFIILNITPSEESSVRYFELLYKLTKRMCYFIKANIIIEFKMPVLERVLGWE